MAILSITTDVTGQVGVAPRNVKIVTTDSLPTALTAGYLNNAQRQGFTFYPTDVIQMVYAYNGTTGSYGQFLPVFANQNNQITLQPFTAINGYANASMTLAQWTGMYAAPVQLVAAPGANQIIMLQRALIYQTYGSAQLTAGGAVAIQYDSTVHGGGVLASNAEQASDFTGAAANQIYQLVGASGNASNSADQSNKGLYISNATQAFATGTGSSFNVHAWYSIVVTP